MFTIRNPETGALAALSRDVRDTHPDWVHAQLGTSDESTLQRFLDNCSIAEFLEGGEDAAGLFIAHADKVAVATALCNALPGGFVYDWRMCWRESPADAERAGRDDPDEHCTEGGDDLAAIPDTASDARADAQDYHATVMASIARSKALEAEAAEAFRALAFERGAALVADAAGEEERFGDAPSYGQVKALLATYGLEV